MDGGLESDETKVDEVVDRFREDATPCLDKYEYLKEIDDQSLDTTYLRSSYGTKPVTYVKQKADICLTSTPNSPSRPVMLS